jgi:hypothetical protein
MSSTKPTNEEIADILEQIADLLEIQDANPFRIQAYRNGAETVRTAEESIAALACERGEESLQALPNIGKGIARLINSFVQNGHSGVLERLQGESVPGRIFTQVPGIGEKLAQRIAGELNISTLEELEQAAHDGRLHKVEGFGAKRVRSIRLSLAGMLSTAARRSRRRAGEKKGPREQPDVEIVLDVDRDYRRKAEAGQLQKIAPRRFNPKGEAWLPILHTERDEWDFTALYSNTAQAHKLNKTSDWVVLYYERNGTEDQATVVTETQGPLEGKRVIRGREADCRRYYKREKAAA